MNYRLGNYKTQLLVVFALVLVGFVCWAGWNHPEWFENINVNVEENIGNGISKVEIDGHTYLKTKGADGNQVSLLHAESCECKKIAERQ
jgi:hypothetical protein